VAKTQLRCADLWKTNWDETARHYSNWWNREGLALGAWRSYKLAKPRVDAPDPGPAKSVEEHYTDAKYRAAANRHKLAWAACPADMLPIADTDIGPGTLSTFLGSEPTLTYETVWYNPCIDDPERHPPLRFDPEQKWWRIHEAVIRENVAASRGNYFTGIPDLIEGIDTLASLRDSQKVMLDLVDRPEWAKARLAQINRAWFEAYSRIYDMVKFDDGGAVWGGFQIWAPGKVAKLQCDASAMLSPAMFAEFVVPYLAEQCAWLDYSVYHLDGTQCIRHLDALLGIDDLDVIEWTPQAGAPSGGSPQWYDLYRRILAAGKSVQAIDVKPEEVVPLLDAVGGKGMLVMTQFHSEAQADKLIRAVEQYR
jgi:hypothetical protein